MRRFLVVVVAVVACGATSDAAVVESWVLRGFGGDQAGAAALVAADARWFGPGEGPSAWVDGAAPYESRDVDVSCEEEGAVICEVSWIDRWIEGVPEIESGSLRIVARVDGALIEGFETFEFSTAIRSAFEEHLFWLMESAPADYESKCVPDPLARSCSQLLVDTVGAWQGSPAGPSG